MKVREVINFSYLGFFTDWSVFPGRSYLNKNNSILSASPFLEPLDHLISWERLHSRERHVCCYIIKSSFHRVTCCVLTKKIFSPTFRVNVDDGTPEKNKKYKIRERKTGDLIGELCNCWCWVCTNRFENQHSRGIELVHNNSGRYIPQAKKKNR